MEDLTGIILRIAGAQRPRLMNPDVAQLFDKLWPVKYQADIVGEREYLTWDEIKRRGVVRQKIRESGCIPPTHLLHMCPYTHEITTGEERYARASARGYGKGLNRALLDVLIGMCASDLDKFINYPWCYPADQNARARFCVVKIRDAICEYPCIRPLGLWMTDEMAVMDGGETSVCVALIEYVHALLVMFRDNPK
jgi:hypothetical protein